MSFSPIFSLIFSSFTPFSPCSCGTCNDEHGHHLWYSIHCCSRHGLQLSLCLHYRSWSQPSLANSHGHVFYYGNYRFLLHRMYIHFLSHHQAFGLRKEMIKALPEYFRIGMAVGVRHVMSVDRVGCIVPRPSWCGRYEFDHCGSKYIYRDVEYELETRCLLSICRHGDLAYRIICVLY